MKVDVHEDISPALRRLALSLGSLRPVFDEIGGSLVSSTQQRFLDQRSPDGQQWAEHSDATKEARGDDADILRDRNHLFDSLDHRPTATSATVGTNMVYGRIHQLGGEAGRNKSVTIDARPYLGVSLADEHEIRDIVAERVAEALQ
jgi:phage virion morphogenesis protein